MLASIRRILVLVIICAVSAASLAYLRQITSPIIEQEHLSSNIAPALKQLFPNAENNPIAESKHYSLAKEGKWAFITLDNTDAVKFFHNRTDITEVTVFPIRQGGKLVAVAIEGGGEGYGGELMSLVGLTLPATGETPVVTGIVVTSMRETPGIGDRALRPGFIKQFTQNANPALRANGGTIDAVSGATITSGAVVASVQAAQGFLLELRENINKDWQ